MNIQSNNKENKQLRETERKKCLMIIKAIHSRKKKEKEKTFVRLKNAIIKHSDVIK